MSFFSELKRRKVFQVAALYVVIAWLLIQVTSTVLPTFNTPDWVNQAFTLLLIIGFPIAMVLAWAYEIRPEDSEPARTKPDNAGTENNLAFEFPVPDKPSIAILPFKSLGSDKDQEFIAEGIRFGIQASLVQVSGLFLVNAAALNAYRNSKKSSQTAGEELEVSYILDAGVQQSGENIRVTTELTDVKNKRTIWAERFEGVVDDVFKLQDKITRDIVSSLNVKLLDSETARIWFETLKDPDAREYYFRGSRYFYELNKEDNTRAREMFKELYRVEPDNVIGPGLIALTYFFDGFAGWSDDPTKSMEEAEKWAIKAMEYKDNNGLGHAVYGYILLRKGHYDEALNVGTAGVKLRASCPLAQGVMGLILNYSGDSESAAEHAKKAIMLEKFYPAWLVNLLAAAYRDSGKPELSVPAAIESIRQDGGNEARAILCSSYERLQEKEKAEEIAKDITEYDPSFSVSEYAKNHPYKDTSTLETILTNLRAAGLPE